MKPIPVFELGKIYQRREDIHLPYGGSWQSGISASSVSDAIFLFTGDSGDQYGYKDEFVFDETGVQVFMYTGEGQAGDMKLTRGNLAISEHSKLGRALYLFEILGKRKGVRYLGEFIYVNHEQKKGTDKTLTEREIIIFHLINVLDAERLELEENGNIDKIEKSTLSLEKMRAAAQAAASNAGTSSEKIGVRNFYLRSKAVKDYVLLRANGVCELCNKPAPFIKKNGTPYLEPHHTTRVSDGGPDHPSHVGGICPSCHTEIHHGENGIEKNILLKNILTTREKEIDNKIQNPNEI
ncbi:MAG: HNH endonuclease [Burkholderiales bacterium]|nr:HNH endonuclease [Burkholderiales bacterium]